MDQRQIGTKRSKGYFDIDESRYKRRKKSEKLWSKWMGVQKPFALKTLKNPNVTPFEKKSQTKSEPESDPDPFKINRKFLRTVSIAVPGSIVENAQSVELKTYVAGQIARAACIYGVDEIIVYCDGSKSDTTDQLKRVIIEKTKDKASLMFGRILQYLECPQYLRKHIFPIHHDLQYAGLLNPLDALHHLSIESDFPFREGIVSNVPLKEGKGSYVNIGKQANIRVDKVLEPNVRVTVKLQPMKPNTKRQLGIVVPPTLPTLERGAYWGYTVRLADSLTEVLSQCPYKGGYDLTIGTSERGTSIDELHEPDAKEKFNTDYKHCLIVFGGLEGLEGALEYAVDLQCDDVSTLFDLYLNTCPQQCSRTIRTEEAVLISLAELRRFLYKNPKVIKIPQT